MQSSDSHQLKINMGKDKQLIINNNNNNNDLYVPGGLKMGFHTVGNCRLLSRFMVSLVF